ncbi:MAG: cytochrome ubiquinol oxidase subunit I [Proteobacteria bacterium]|nr:cytochrome ubiquinol oxidase subunit I [Pseudomonadota bacterium]MBU1736897.1 cytochrome ubiquinol oxidase subunit I [Pseudomonadota bacterium]
MNYPVWQLDFAGGGLLIALIATLHVYISHFAIGGGLFLVLTEHKGLRENSPSILGYVYKHTRLFVLLTMVLGALTGVGIWFTISVLNPAATSKLIHLFVFAWATEWVFFLVEIISLFIYYKTFNRISNRTHLTIGWIYFAAAFLSLFVINGIVGFMLTPGEWLITGNFWHGFFHPTFWPSLFFRFFLAIMLAGLFGFLTASWSKDDALRTTLVRYCAKWLLAPFVLFLTSAWWYKSALPPDMHELIFKNMPDIQPVIKIFIVCSPLIILGGLGMAIKMPANINRGLAAVMLVLGLFYLGSFEFIRESGRRPYIIHNFMYSNTILKTEIDAVKDAGILHTAKWVDTREIKDENMSKTGRQVFDLLCLSCHSVGGPFNNITSLTQGMKPKGMTFIYESMGNKRAYMPPFIATAKEAEALTHFIFSDLER